MKTDTTERGLERLICAAMTGTPGDPVPAGATAVANATQPTALYGGTGWLLGDWRDFDRE